ncbi:uncharacterized protein LOC119403054 [Rhipicephalus sanguineus]|uniref:uncharacterized protein LOC119403054 n=1 Tax=Rhipicephalus sanguineus TaxID=34632 RepID=UPI0020C59523|nr:uncharacterized protein LOC119403054 [Rhipicephalus sanguineus]
MVSAMAARIRPYATLCRAAGVFFIRNIHCANPRDAVVSWKSWYTLYSVGCLLTFTLGQLYFVANNTIRVFASVRSFTKSLVLVLPTVVAFKVTVNIASSVFGSWTMLEFFKMSAEHELKSAFDWKKYRYGCRLSYALRFFVGISFFAHLIANANITIKLLHIEGNSFLEFVLKAVMFLFNFLFFTYDMLHFIILRPCCEVLISYIRQEQDSLNYILAMSETPFTKIAAVDKELDRVRLNMSSIVSLRKVLNSVWQFSIMASAAGLLIVSCINIYSLFDEGVPKDQLLLIMSYCGYATVDFVDVARLSQTMGNEVLKLRESLMKVAVFHDSPTHFRRVAYLHGTLEPDEMFLSGGNFFTLNLPLLVSINEFVRAEVARQLWLLSTAGQPPSPLPANIRQVIQEQVCAALPSARDTPPAPTPVPCADVNSPLSYAQVAARSPPQSFPPLPSAVPLRPTPRLNHAMYLQGSGQWRTFDNRPMCFACGLPGHVARYCRRRVRPYHQTFEPDPYVSPRPSFSASRNPGQMSSYTDHHPPANRRSPSPRRRSLSPMRRRPSTPEREN